MKNQAKKDFFKNTTKFCINKLSNLGCKNFIKFVKVSKQPLVIALIFSQCFYGVFLDLPSTIKFSQYQQRWLILKNCSEFSNCLILINFNFYIKNTKNLLYPIKKTNNLIREYYFQKFSSKEKKQSFFIIDDYWSISKNFQKAYKFSRNLKNIQNNSKIKIIAKNIFYLLNVYSEDFSLKIKYQLKYLNKLKYFKNQFYRIYQNFKILKKIFHEDIDFQNFERSNQNTYLLQRPINFPSQWIQKGDLLADCSASDKGEIALGQNLLVAYMPWEGFNFEDAVLINETILSKYTSLHIAKYDLEISEKINSLEKITSNIPGFSKNALQKLDKNGIIKIGSWVQEGDILIGKIISSIPQPLLTHEKLLYDILGKKTLPIEEKCLRVPLGVSGRIIRISYIYSKNQPLVKKNPLRYNRNNGKFASKKIVKSALKKVSIYIMEKRFFQVGDKISGRHGNKGIISKVFSNYDMPYLADGSSLDVILNPLGVPSRMNVGQILECLLGFAGKIFHTKFQVLCFDEIYGYEASRSYIYSKLLDACKKTQQKWIFSKKNPGKLHLFDGRNGYIFHQSVMVGVTYLMKLIHIVDEKIHARATGPYSLITQQPLRGRAKHGGQRIGEMEVWALQGFGCAYTLQEILTVKSDDLQGRKQIMQALLKNTPLKFGTPESFRVVLRELQCLCLDLQLSI